MVVKTDVLCVDSAWGHEMKTSDLKILFLMIRNSEITIEYPYGFSYSAQHQ